MMWLILIKSIIKIKIYSEQIHKNSILLNKSNEEHYWIKYGLTNFIY